MEQPPEGARPISTAASIASVLDTHLAIPDEITEISAPIRPFVSDEHPPSGATTPRDSYAPSSANNSSPLIPLAQKEEQDPNDATEDLTEAKKKPSLFRRSFLLPIALLVLIVIILAIVLPVYYTVVKPNKGKNGSKLGSGPASPKSTGGPGKNPGSPSGATSGGNGSVVVTEDGTSFVYSNPFGGYWVSDPNNPFNNSARPNSWTPPLDTPWTFGKDKIYGVNLGGLFVLEPFITPALFQKYNLPPDEWHLSLNMAAANGSLAPLEDHYNTFITEQDIAEIAGAGLNWIRLPIPFWAIETWPGEPFLAKTSWKYILRIFDWCRKYGLRINLDLHTIPGSQNGLLHSGLQGEINFLLGVMGIANAQRATDYIRIITEFISQPEYQNLIPIFGIINEAYVNNIGQDQITRYYLQTHNMIRNITGYGGNNGPYISIHDGFLGLTQWADFLPGSDRIMLDTHPYFAFVPQPNDPIATGTGAGAGGPWPGRACGWGSGINASQTAFGVTVAGEFSNAWNDCGLYVNGIGDTHLFAGDCNFWSDATQWDAASIAGVKAFALASMDALQDWFFWTWKIGNSTTSTSPTSPLWSYQLGLQLGFIPTDPRESVGKCASLGVSGDSFDGTYQPWQTGGQGAGTISASASAAFSQYPPPELSGVPASAMPLLPTYTNTGKVATLPPPTFTASATQSTSSLDGWYDTADTGGGVTTVSGCSYPPNAWSASDAPVPTVSACGGGGGGPAAAVITTAPARRR